MKNKTTLFILLTGILLVAQSALAAAPSALILYDRHLSDNAGKLGIAYAIMLRNLLGHFDMAGDLQPIENYVAGNIENYVATFYIGNYYDNPVPAAFMTDVAKTAKPVTWFRYNIWQMAWDPTFNFTQKYGFSFSGLRGLNSPPSSSSPNPGFFDTVNYKGQDLVKYYSYNPTTDTANADPDVGVTQITDPTLASSVATIKNARTGEQLPYIVHSKNFWYFADVPFTYIGPRDRYLVFCDVLHDILGINHAENHRAMVRLEDVDAEVDSSSMKLLSDYLSSKSIPFSIATIPFYKDPLGWYNNGVPLSVHMNKAKVLLNSLKYATARGGSILMHGYTHQYDSTPNLYTAVSADDFEFWYATKNSMLPEDSLSWALGRLSSGLTEMSGVKITPFAWEAPHYQGSPSANRAFAQTFKTTYQRAVYYTSETPSLDPANPKRDYLAGQFFPYVISSDYYGQRILPENLGNIEYDISNVDPFSNVVYTWDDIYTNAQYAKVVRDGFASFFFHPFWVEQDFAYLNAYPDFQSLVQGITGLGYKWVAAQSL